MRRFGGSEDVAATTVMLVSDETTYMSGAEYTVDGGVLAVSTAISGDREHLGFGIRIVPRKEPQTMSAVILLW